MKCKIDITTTILELLYNLQINKNIKVIYETGTTSSLELLYNLCIRMKIKSIY